MNEIWIEGRNTLFTSGPETFVSAAQRLFRDAGAQTLDSGKVDQNADDAGERTNDAAFDYACAIGRDMSLDALVICTFWKTPISEDDVGRELYRPVDYLKAAKAISGRYPSYAIVVVPAALDRVAGAGVAATNTLCRYLATHLITEDVRINVVQCSPTDAGMKRAADTVFVLCSGLLSDLHGQVLRVSES